MLVEFSTEKIRKVGSLDLDEILLIEQSCYTHPWTYEMFAQELNNPAANFICYVENTTISGYLCYWYVAGELEILNVATAVNMQRRGIARALLDFAFRQVAPSELTGAFLEVRAGNSGAIALYKSVGFKQVGIRRHYYRDGEDAILMGKTFTL